MTGLDYFVFALGALLIVSILAGVLSSRIGAPLLLVFLVIGMLIGEDGLGGVQFDNFPLAYLIGSLALAVILFDGGFRTPLSSVRVAWRPAAVLATLGVVITAAATAGFAAPAFGGRWLPSLLAGAIVASTDAAAVFLLLHQQGMQLRRRVSATLEVESGANDPVAIFLTVGLVDAIVHPAPDLSLGLLQTLALQMGVGTVAGFAGGWLISWSVNRLELAPGLYPVFVVSGALAVFGGTQILGGSGFLAVYLAGIVAGNRRTRASLLIRRFHDGIAWISQIVMFLMLGLLVTPTRLVGDLAPAALVAGGLIFIARPLAVSLCLLPFGFSRAELLFISWVGLRGAVPIFLAILPVLGGVPDAMRYFDIAFLVVLASLVLQGWTIPWLARRLGLEVPPQPEPSGRLDLMLPSRMDRELIGYRVNERSAVAGKTLDSLTLPRRTRVLSLLRGDAVVPQPAVGVLQPGDYILLLCPPEQIFHLDRLFVPRRAVSAPREGTALGDFSFDGATTLGALTQLYDLTLPDEDRDMTVGDYLAERLGKDASVGDVLRLGGSALVVREVADGRIVSVGLRLDVTEPPLLPAPVRKVIAAGRALATRMRDRLRRRKG